MTLKAAAAQYSIEILELDLIGGLLGHIEVLGVVAVTDEEDAAVVHQNLRTGLRSRLERIEGSCSCHSKVVAIV